MPLAFSVLATLDLLMVMRPETPVRFAVWVTLAALAATAWVHQVVHDTSSQSSIRHRDFEARHIRVDCFVRQDAYARSASLLVQPGDSRMSVKTGVEA
jgi:hypothetical protein